MILIIVMKYTNKGKSIISEIVEVVVREKKRKNVCSLDLIVVKDEHVVLLLEVATANCSTVASAIGYAHFATCTRRSQHFDAEYADVLDHLHLGLGEYEHAVVVVV